MSPVCAQIVRACSGFVYVLARAGITGGVGSEGPAVEAIGRRVRELREATDLPLAVGFGISTEAHVRAVVQEAGADAAIVGSALVKRMEEAGRSGRDAVGEGETFVRALAGGLA